MIFWVICHFYLSAIYLLERDDPISAVTYINYAEELFVKDNYYFPTLCFWKLYIGNLTYAKEKYYFKVINGLSEEAKILDYRTTQFVCAAVTLFPHRRTAAIIPIIVVSLKS